MRLCIERRRQGLDRRSDAKRLTDDDCDARVRAIGDGDRLLGIVRKCGIGLLELHGERQPELDAVKRRALRLLDSAGCSSIPRAASLALVSASNPL